MNRKMAAWTLLLLGAGALTAQEPDANNTEPAEPSIWNLFYQATSIGQEHGTFNSPYTGPLSLQDHPEHVVSLTTTLFFGLRLSDNTQFYFDPEIAGGRGFSGVNGIADAPNGELPRVASATPKPYIARLYITHDFGFGSEKEHIEDDPNQLAGDRPMTRYTIVVGRFSVTDFFDNNIYTHDPRTQFIPGGLCTTARGIIRLIRAATPGAGSTNSTRATGPCDIAAPPNPKWRTAHDSTGACFAIAAIRSKVSAAIPSELIPALSACLDT